MFRETTYCRHNPCNIFGLSVHSRSGWFVLFGIEQFSFRLLKRALELKKPVMLLNVGPSRADGVPGVVKIDMASGTIFKDVAKAVM